MDNSKYVMLKAILANKTTISVGAIKNEFNVDAEEGEEMLQNLIQEGLVEPYSIDGTSFMVKKDNPF